MAYSLQVLRRPRVVTGSAILRGNSVLNEFVRLSAQLPSEQQAQIYRELSLAINQGEIELTPDVLGVLF